MWGNSVETVSITRMYFRCVTIASYNQAAHHGLYVSLIRSHTLGKPQQEIHMYGQLDLRHLLESYVGASSLGRNG
jgi:hypothetical protein